MKTNVWVTQDGRKIKVEDMDDNHIYNTIRLLKRNIAEYENALEHYPSFQGEMAQDHAERMWVNASYALKAMRIWLMALEKEVKKRNKKITKNRFPPINN